MAEYVDLRDKIRKYYTYAPNEIKGLAIAIFVIGFIISFREWGIDDFDIDSGIFNLVNAILIVALSLLVHDAAQRIWGLAIGYRIEFKMSITGLFLALLLAFMANGSLWLIIPGGFIVHHLAGHRLGWFRYGINYWGQAMVSLAGPLATLSLIILLKTLNVFAPNYLIQKAIVFNVIFLVTSMLPIPILPGGKIIYASRMAYAFLFPAIVFATILLMVDIPVFMAIVLSLLVGIILWILYYISFERKIWTGLK